MRPTVNGNRTSDRRESRKFEDRDYLPASMEAAAQEAAIADGIITGDTHDSKSKKAALRRGKWTSEEEAYANRLIYEFKLGLLPLNDGTTLRTFLSKLLNCDPMRISKKFVGQNCIGKVCQYPAIILSTLSLLFVCVYSKYFDDDNKI